MVTALQTPTMHVRRQRRANSDPKENGCPPDTDGDGIRDDVDACPTRRAT